MTGIPPLPEPPRMIPAAQIWTALAIPPALTVAGNLSLGMLSKHQGGELLLIVPVFTGLAILVLSVVFFDAVRQRYRGVSLVFLQLSYLLGQAIICLALWFGTCLLIL